MVVRRLKSFLQHSERVERFNEGNPGPELLERACAEKASTTRILTARTGSHPLVTTEDL